MNPTNTMLPTVTTLRWVPDFARGLVRDLRVRWALEEAGLAYQVETVDFEEKELPAYKALQPFGKVPVFRDSETTLFESGAIVHRIAARSAALMPQDETGRSHTLSWMFAALNSVEPAVMSLIDIDIFNADTAWAAERRPAAEKNVTTRLADLDRVLSERDYLVGQFTAADILMTTVLNFLRHTQLVEAHAHLHAYQQRCMARPAAQRALAAQMAQYADEPMPA